MHQQIMFNLAKLNMKLADSLKEVIHDAKTSR
jgi:hypothetical protein